MTGDEAVQYDISKFRYVGAIESGNIVISVSTDGKIKNVDDLKAAKGLKFSHSARTSLPALANALAIDILGLDGKLITGFDGSTGKILAVQQGDAQGTAMPPDSALIAKSKGQVLPIMQVGTARMKPVSDLPALLEIVKTDKLTDNQKKLVSSIGILSDSKAMFAPPGTPQDRIDFLTVAFKKMYDTPAFKEDLKKVIGAEIGDYITGEELSKLTTGLVAQKGDMKLWDDLLTKYVK
jgi:tripartite-type tricarboxylate transporter receptor subunit TctC